MKMNEVSTINAVVRLGKEEYPERKRTTIVITDCGDEICIGVKTIACVFEKGERGLDIHEEQHGEIAMVRKDMTVGSLFETIKELFEKVPEIIDRTNTNGDMA